MEALVVFVPPVDISVHLLPRLIYPSMYLDSPAILLFLSTQIELQGEFYHARFLIYLKFQA